MARKGCSQQPPHQRGDPRGIFRRGLFFCCIFVGARPLPPPPPELWEHVSAGWGSCTCETISRHTDQVGCSPTGESDPRGCRAFNARHGRWPRWRTAGDRRSRRGQRVHVLRPCVFFFLSFDACLLSGKKTKCGPALHRPRHPLWHTHRRDTAQPQRHPHPPTTHLPARRPAPAPLPLPPPRRPPRLKGNTRCPEAYPPRAPRRDSPTRRRGAPPLRRPRRSRPCRTESTGCSLTGRPRRLRQGGRQTGRRRERRHCRRHPQPHQWCHPPPQPHQQPQPQPHLHPH